MGNLTPHGLFRIAERATLYFWSAHESQRLIVGYMQRKQEHIKSMDFRTCTSQKAIHVLESAVFANNSEMSSSAMVNQYREHTL